MKPNKILIVALAAGLMAFAADKARALVVENELFSPLNIKLSVSYYDAKGNIKQVRITSKDVLKEMGAPSGTTLAVEFDSGDVFIITKTTVEDNLTAEGIVTANLSDTLDSEIDKDNGAYKYSEVGILELDVYDNPQFDEGLDKPASEEASDEWFEITGYYNYNESGSAIDNSGNQKFSSKLKAKSLSGFGHDSALDLDIPSTTVLTGSVTESGSGKLDVRPE